MTKSKTKPIGATSYKETAFGILSRSKLLNLELQGTKRGLDYIYDLAKKNNIVVISPKLICKLHKISFGWIFPTWAGKYRKIQVTYSGKEAPSFFRILELIQNLCEDLKEQRAHLPNQQDESFILEIVKLIAWFQYQLVFIHPFQDYNGRTARMLSALLILQFDLPSFEIKAENEIDRERYLKAMRKGDKGDLSDLEAVISESLIEALEQFSK